MLSAWPRSAAAAPMSPGFDFPAFNLTESSAPDRVAVEAGLRAVRAAAWDLCRLLRWPARCRLRAMRRGADIRRSSPSQPSGRRPTAAASRRRRPPSWHRSRIARRASSTAMGTPTERAPVAERRYEAPRAAAGGETIEVQPGDTLFGIAKRHGVQVGTLIEVNGLQNGTSIKPGQRLTLPVGATPARAAPETRAPIASRTTQPMQTGAIDTSRLGRPPHAEPGRVALRRRAAVWRAAGRAAARQRHQRSRPRCASVRCCRCRVMAQATGGGEPVAERAPEPAPSRTQAPINLGPRVVQIPDAGQGAQSRCRPGRRSGSAEDRKRRPERARQGCLPRRHRNGCHR